MILKHLLFLAVGTFLCTGTNAITMPAPPPELPDTLINFRTKEQLNEDKTRDNDVLKPLSERLNIDSAPFVPGDDVAGIARLSFVYTPDVTIGIPASGMSIVRFYDLKGAPWEIVSVKTENQGFSAEKSASSSELVIKQHSGAAGTTMVVFLQDKNVPLVFHLSSVNLKRDDVDINTIINTCTVKSYNGLTDYMAPAVNKVPAPNPDAQTIKLKTEGSFEIEQILTDAVRMVKADEEN
ncbi:MAG: DotH/IcmK family type IV secretion protein [Succinivibrio sp.]